MAFFKKAFVIFNCALALWVGGFALFVFSALSMSPENPDQKTDAIVVLTGGQMRIETGLSLLSEDKSQQLFITGVHPYVDKKDITDKWTEKKGLPDCCITLGHKATTTVENADETKTWLEGTGFKTIRLVTADFHMHRAMLEFRSIMPTIKIIPHPIVQPNTTTQDRRFWELAFIEYHKTVFRWLRVLLSSFEGASA